MDPKEYSTPGATPPGGRSRKDAPEAFALLHKAFNAEGREKALQNAEAQERFDRLVNEHPSFADPVWGKVRQQFFLMRDKKTAVDGPDGHWEGTPERERELGVLSYLEFLIGNAQKKFGRRAMMLESVRRLLPETIAGQEPGPDRVSRVRERLFVGSALRNRTMTLAQIQTWFRYEQHRPDISKERAAEIAEHIGKISTWPENPKVALREPMVLEDLVLHAPTPVIALPDLESDPERADAVLVEDSDGGQLHKEESMIYGPFTQRLAEGNVASSTPEKEARSHPTKSFVERVANARYRAENQDSGLSRIARQETLAELESAEEAELTNLEHVLEAPVDVFRGPLSDEMVVVMERDLSQSSDLEVVYYTHNLLVLKTRIEALKAALAASPEDVADAPTHQAPETVPMGGDAFEPNVYAKNARMDLTAVPLPHAIAEDVARREEGIRNAQTPEELLGLRPDASRVDIESAYEEHLARLDFENKATSARLAQAARARKNMLQRVETQKHETSAPVLPETPESILDLAAEASREDIDGAVARKLHGVNYEDEANAPLIQRIMNAHQAMIRRVEEREHKDAQWKELRKGLDNAEMHRPFMVDPVKPEGWWSRQLRTPGAKVRALLFGAAGATAVAGAAIALHEFAETESDSSHIVVGALEDPTIDEGISESEPGPALVADVEAPVTDHVVAKGETLWNVLKDKIQDRGLRATSEKILTLKHFADLENPTVDWDTLPIGQVIHLASVEHMLDEMEGKPLMSSVASGSVESIPHDVSQSITQQNHAEDTPSWIAGSDAPGYESIVMEAYADIPREERSQHVMQKGEWIYKLIHLMLRDSGLNWSTPRITRLKNMTLQENGLSEEQAKKIPVGAIITFDSAVREIQAMKAAKEKGKKK